MIGYEADLSWLGSDFYVMGFTEGQIPPDNPPFAIVGWVKETLGDVWLTPERFRFGASSLVNDVLMQWRKADTGRYQSPIYFSED